MDGLSAFATGVTTMANINKLKKSSTSVATLNFFLIQIKPFGNEIMPLHNYEVSSQI